MEMGRSPTVVFRDARLCAATWGRIFFEVWTSEGTAAHFRALESLCLDHVREQAGAQALHFTTVLLTSIPRLDAPTRRAMEQRSRALAPHTRASVVVLETNGFIASIVRSVLVGISTGLRLTQRFHVTGTLDEGCQVASRALDGRPSAREIRAAHDAIAQKGPEVGALIG
jgi:hypothetical protein